MEATEQQAMRAVHSFEPETFKASYPETTERTRDNGAGRETPNGGMMSYQV